MATDTKITLIKKSGPGVLIGLVELTSKNGYVDFGGLQFELPGEYVISVISESDLVENTEISITVLPSDDIIGQDNSEVSEPKAIEGTRPIIAQIEKTSIKLDPIEFEGNDAAHDNEVAGGLGFTPFFWYNGYQVSDRDISSLNLYYEGIIPKVSIIFIDSMGFMKKDGFPLDDAKFEIFLNSGTKNLKSIHLKFKLENFQENKRKNYTIVGTLDVTLLYNIAFKSYRGTSFEVLKKMSTELELGFNSNISNTFDSMNWVNNGKDYKDFLLNVINHSYISDSSYVLGYIDFYYCFNYVDIEKEWLRDISKDVGLNSTGINYLNSDSEKDNVESLVLTDDQSANSSPFYFSSYKLNNNSTQISLENGHFTKSKVYDSISKQFLIFDVNSQTSDGVKTHILKGAPGDSKDILENYRTKYSGKMDTENVYKNYYYSETQNKVNLENLVRISVDIVLPNPNFNLYKFMKIKMIFVNKISSPSNDEIIQSRLTGEWLIADIGYSWSRGKLEQNVNLVRKEIGKTPTEIESDKNNMSSAGPEVNSEDNDNPIINSDVVEYSDSVVLPAERGVFQFGEEQDTIELNDEYRTSDFIGDSEEVLTIEQMKLFDPDVVNNLTSEEIAEIKESYNRGTPLKSPPRDLLLAMRKYGITSNLERAHFLAQCAHESGDFQWTQEQGGIKYFTRKYEGRSGLGNTSTGDGFKYHGRGYIQITGKFNYAAYSKYLVSKGGDNVLLNPGLVSSKYAADSACYWWKFINRSVSKSANGGSSSSVVKTVTNAVNGGNRGLDDRVSRFNGYYAEIKNDGSKYA